jgi:hypothetical protein
MPENDHVIALRAARVKVVEARRTQARYIREGHAWDGFRAVQDTIEAIDRAIRDEEK